MSPGAIQSMVAQQAAGESWTPTNVRTAQRPSAARGAVSTRTKSTGAIELASEVAPRAPAIVAASRSSPRPRSEVNVSIAKYDQTKSVATAFVVSAGNTNTTPIKHNAETCRAIANLPADRRKPPKSVTASAA